MNKKKEVDFDENGELNNFEKSVYSYNNAITTLNTACESLVTKSDKITDVRCVGSNPTDKDSENIEKYTSDNLKKWASGIGDNKGKSTDNNYATDFEQMKNLAILTTDNYNYYWLASRFVKNSAGYMRYIWCNGLYDEKKLWNVDNTSANGSNGSYGLRPVVSLKSDISFSGSGTAEDPYTF